MSNVKKLRADLNMLMQFSPNPDLKQLDLSRIELTIIKLKAFPCNSKQAPVANAV